jgi:exopolyphosphatase/guanosine-5'-triphosphate,3'-diphosphate pyrophosphatase
MRVAVLDLGSTSFHLLVVDVDSRGRMKRVLRRREVLHLASDVAVHGHLPAESAAAAIRAARVLRRAADAAEPAMTVGAATQALREAANGGELLRELQIATRCPIRLLDGCEEARVVYEGIRWSIPLGETPTLVVDLGGGSLELAVGVGSEVRWDASYALGASRLTGELLREDPPADEECRAIIERVSGTLGPAATHLSRNHPYLPCVGTGGTIRAIARLELARRGIDADSVNGAVVPTARLYFWASKLTKLPRARRLEIPGMAVRRVNVLPAGALVLATLCEQLDLPGITVSEGGLREGLVLQALEGRSHELAAADL